MSQARRQYEAKVQALQKAEAEIERLKAAIESQKDQWLSWESKRVALEKDAARYQFLRRGTLPFHEMQMILNDSPMGIDETVDKAMEAK